MKIMFRRSIVISSIFFALLIFTCSQTPQASAQTASIGSSMEFSNYCMAVQLDPSLSAKLTADITINDYSSNILGTQNKYIGTFDGDGHTITINNSHTGLFDEIGKDGVVKNLHVVIKNARNTTTKITIGGIAIQNRGTVSNCIVEIPKNCSLMSDPDPGNTTGVSGIVGSNWETVENCLLINDGEISGGGNWYCGGVTGINYQNGKIADCTVRGTGTISYDSSGYEYMSAGEIGGICGWNYGTIQGCIIEGDLKLSLTGSDGTVSNVKPGAIGGIAGASSSSAGGMSTPGKIDNCLVYGNVQLEASDQGRSLGGIVGFLQGTEGKLLDCFYNSSRPIPAGDNFNPIIGLWEGGRLENCFYSIKKTQKADPKGIGINNTFLITAEDDTVKLSDTITTQSGVMCAGRHFYYPGEKAPVAYTGYLYPGTAAVFVVKGNGKSYTVNRDAITMPEYDITVSSKIITDIATIAPALTETTFKYDGTSKNLQTLDSKNGTLTNGKEFTATYKNEAGEDVDECIEPGKYSVKIWGEGDYGGYVLFDEKLTIIKDEENNNNKEKDSEIIDTALPAKLTSKGKKKLSLSWNKVQGTAGYDIFFAKCNHKKKNNECRKVKTITGNNNFRWTRKGLRKRTAYKAYVKAFAYRNGKKIYIATSPVVHEFTGGGTKKYTNAKAVKLKKTRVTLRKGRTFKIKAKVVKLKKKKKLMPKIHAPKLRYMTSNSKVAVVSDSGRITAKGKGTCVVYAYAHNGVSGKIKVTVR